jgi:hypothetical protein
MFKLLYHTYVNLSILLSCPLIAVSVFVVYSPYLLELPGFDTATLVSAARMATTYDNQKLRDYALQKLDCKRLPVLEHVPLAQEFSVPAWENQALDILVQRLELVTLAEAHIPSFDALVSYYTKREIALSRGSARSSSVPDPVGSSM